MRILLLIFSFLFSFPAYSAGWIQASKQIYHSGPTSYCSTNIPGVTSQIKQSTSRPFYLTGETVNNWSTSCIAVYKYTPDTLTDADLPAGYHVVNYNYTDETCSTLYGAGYTYTGNPEDGTGSACSAPTPEDFNFECEAIKPDYVTLPVDPGLGFSWDSGGCRFTTSDVVPCLETPSGEFSCNVTTAEALQVEPPLDEEPLPTDGRDSSTDYTETSDPATDCPFSNVSWGGVTYCYSGPDADQGAAYADSSTRVDHWDGSYTVTDSQGTSVTYNADGTPSGTASNLPGAGPSGDGYCPDWWCDGTGVASSEAPAVPQEVISVADKEVLYDSGMAETATCPPPEEVTFSLGGQSMSIGFAYDGFCTLAGYLRPLLLAMANLAAAMLIYRGIL